MAELRRSGEAGCRDALHRVRFLRIAAGFALSLMVSGTACGQQAAQSATKDAALPEAPQPRVSQSLATEQDKTKQPQPCPSLLGIFPEKRADAGSAQTTGSAQAQTGTQSSGAVTAPAGETDKADAQAAQKPCSSIPIINWYARFLNGPEVKPLTPREKAHLAARNVIDPFNAVTILGISGISVAANSHSAYGPGMMGFERYVGVSYAQDVTGEFFGTFLIPSIVHQDPHYHRMPNASFKRRIAHAIYQVVWTQGDDGKEMMNYANLAGYAIDDEIGNLYVPGRQTDATATASRYAIGLATAPIDNFVTEFLPDVARRIHIRVVLIQDIINQVALTKTSNSASQ